MLPPMKGMRLNPLVPPVEATSMTRTLVAAVVVSVLGLAGMGVAVHVESLGSPPMATPVARQDRLAVALARSIAAPAAATVLTVAACNVENEVACWSVNAGFDKTKYALVSQLARVTGTTPQVDCPTPALVVGAGFCRLSASPAGHRIGIVVNSEVTGRAGSAKPTGVQLVVVTAG